MDKINSFNNFFQIKNSLENLFPNEHDYYVASQIFYLKNINPDERRLRYCDELFKKNINFFSNFKGRVKLSLISLMSLSKKPEEYLNYVLKVQKILKKTYHSTAHLALLSAILPGLMSFDDFVKCYERSKNLNKLLTKKYLIIWDQEIVLNFLLTFSKQSDIQLINNVVNTEKIMKQNFGRANGILSMSMILALYNNDSNNKSDLNTKIISLNSTLNSRGYQFDKYSNYSIIASLSLIEKNYTKIVDDLIEAENYVYSYEMKRDIFSNFRRSKFSYAQILVNSSSNKIRLFEDQDIQNSFNMTLDLITAFSVLDRD